MNKLLKGTELFQLTRDRRNYKIAKAIIINNLLLSKNDEKLQPMARKLHNMYTKQLNIKPFDYYLELHEETILNKLEG